MRNCWVSSLFRDVAALSQRTDSKRQERAYLEKSLVPSSALSIKMALTE